MSQYTDPGDWCEPVGGILYRSTAPLTWHVGCKGSGLAVTVPAGATFDVTIPRGLCRIFSPHDPRSLRAAALHDELLRRGWGRTTAGAIFHDALRADGMSRWRRLAMWLAVSLFKYH